MTTTVEAKNIFHCNIYGACAIDADGMSSEVASVNTEHGQITLVSPDASSYTNMQIQMHKNVLMINGGRKARVSVNGKEARLGELVDAIDAKRRKTDEPLTVQSFRAHFTNTKISILNLFDGATLSDDVTIASTLLNKSLTITVSSGQTLRLPDDSIFESLVINVNGGRVSGKGVKTGRLEVSCMAGSVSGISVIDSVDVVCVHGGLVEIETNPETTRFLYSRRSSVYVNKVLLPPLAADAIKKL